MDTRDLGARGRAARQRRPAVPDHHVVRRAPPTRMRVGSVTSAVIELLPIASATSSRRAPVGFDHRVATDS